MLPLYVFTKEGVWVMETAAGDIAYQSQHLLENINCFDNPKLVQRVLGGVVFCANDGLYVVSGTKLQKISTPLEGRVILQDIDGIENRINGNLQLPDNEVLSIRNAAKRIDNITKDYFTENSFCIYDKIENELLLIEPNKDFTPVLQLNDMSWTMRKDLFTKLKNNFGVSQRNLPNFDDYTLINGEYILIKKQYYMRNGDKGCTRFFYLLSEGNTSKGAAELSNNAVVFASGVIMMNQYMKIEHIISRFTQLTDTDFDSHLFLIGSRDGIEWKVLNHSHAKFPKSFSGQEMRRCFASARYFQFVYIRLERNGKNTTNRRDSYFERFTFDMSNSDGAGKIR
jgi:hypothetical protein